MAVIWFNHMIQSYIYRNTVIESYHRVIELRLEGTLKIIQSQVL